MPRRDPSVYIGLEVFFALLFVALFGVVLVSMFALVSAVADLSRPRALYRA